MAQRAETIVAECSLTSFVRARFPDRFPHYACRALSAHTDIQRWIPSTSYFIPWVDTIWNAVHKEGKEEEGKVTKEVEEM